MLRLLPARCRPRARIPPSPIFTLSRSLSSAALLKGEARKAEWRKIRDNAQHAKKVEVGLLPADSEPGKPLGDPRDYLAKLVVGWVRLQENRRRLVKYGLPPKDIKPALELFAKTLQTRDIFSDLGFTRERVDRIVHDLSQGEIQVAPTLTRLFYEWGAHPSTHANLSMVVSPDAIASISALFHAADMLNPGAKYALTRASPRRKVIMHVGTTNSGKTHNALRALAAAEYGMYAGPLRLLAHEIWDRLNKGQIVPLGQDPDASAEADEDTNIDAAPAGEKPAIQKHGNKRYARACNLITGEEQRIVDVGAGLMSCTVEMTPSMMEFDVAVIDEIQMIADPERGSAWSQALLSLHAKEIHLCGEETAVPLIEAILRDTGDEIIVNRYKRLSPLRCAETSLKGDYSKAEKGDCFVCFSRSGIFKTKAKIEEITKLKCAVAYGRLPPELRTEQAALFNDPKSGYDVMVGSDAIGMGLNL